MKNLLSTAKIPLASLLTALLLCVICLFLGESKIGSLLNTISGSIVMLLSIISYIYYVYVDKKINKIPQFCIATGLLVLLVEYISSVIFRINLNAHVSIAWCDTGISFLLFGALFKPVIKRISVALFKCIKKIY